MNGRKNVSFVLNIRTIRIFKLRNIKTNPKRGFEHLKKNFYNEKKREDLQKIKLSWCLIPNFNLVKNIQKLNLVKWDFFQSPSIFNDFKSPLKEVCLGSTENNCPENRFYNTIKKLFIKFNLLEIDVNELYLNILRVNFSEGSKFTFLVGF